MGCQLCKRIGKVIHVTFKNLGLLVAAHSFAIAGGYDASIVMDSIPKYDFPRSQQYVSFPLHKCILILVLQYEVGVTI